MMNRKPKPTVALVANTSWSLYNFRLGLIRLLQKRGYKVLAIAPPDDFTGKLIDEGCHFEPVELDNYGTNPIKDFKSFRQFLRIYRKQKIDFIFHYTIKPNIYGSFAARLLNIPFIGIVTGLGQLFTHYSWKTTLARFLYTIAFQSSKEVWFLNESDAAIFMELNIVPEFKIRHLPSEGVDMQYFKQYRYGLYTDHIFKFLFAGRMIIEKGIRDYVAAARILKRKNLNVEFQLLGFIDPKNPRSIKSKEINGWQQEGIINYLGSTEDVRPFLEKSDCMVLPTYYREGVPRILLEAASMQIPIITTDNVGCRQVVEDEVNGLLCRKQDPENLAKCMQKMVALDLEKRTQFGVLGRRRVYAFFNEKYTNRRYLKALNYYIGKGIKYKIPKLQKEKTDSQLII